MCMTTSTSGAEYIDRLERENEVLKRELDMAKEENHILWGTVNNGTRLRTGEIIPPSTITVFGMTLRQIADMKGALERETGRAAANWKAAETLPEANELLRRELQEAREQLDRIWDALTAAGHPADGETSTAEMVAAALLGAGQLALDMATDLAAARAKLEECGRDSTRIDWLQAQLDEHGTVWMLPCGDDMRFVQVRNFGECLNYPTVTGKLREALDAALAQDNEP